MEKTATRKNLNPVQLHLLKMFAYKSDDGLKELQSVLFNYYKDELRKKTDHYWQENNLTDAWMEEIMYGHNRIHK